MRVRSAIKAGWSDPVLSIQEPIVRLPKPEVKKRGPFKKRIFRLTHYLGWLLAGTGTITEHAVAKITNVQMGGWGRPTHIEANSNSPASQLEMRKPGTQWFETSGSGATTFGARIETVERATRRKPASAGQLGSEGS